jgi:phospholipid/cholesterol/gamma-HCH transport system permease protein
MGSTAERWGRVAAPLSGLGKGFMDLAATVGGMGMLLGRVLWRTVRLDFDREELLRNLEKMAVRSVPLVIVTAVFVGGIMVIQAAPTVERLGAHGLLGWGAGFGILREIGPLLTALMLSGRVGANNTAELGTMVVTEQVDALRALAIDPLAYLIVPRFLGILITLLLSVIFADVLALVGAAYGGQLILGVEPVVFYNGLTSGLIKVGDVMHGVIKSVVFGTIIALTSCQFGISTSGGAPGVGRSVNAAVVSSATGIFLLDYLVSFAIG